MWKLFQQNKSSKMKIASQESCQLNQSKSSSILNRTGPQEFDNLSSYTLPRGVVPYKSSTLPPPPPPPSRTTTNYSSTNKTRPSSVVTMSVGDDSCAINELLEGRMYLTVLLPLELINQKGSPAGSKVVINVERRTPMMDILVNIATQYKFNASKYRIHVDGHNFKASTPIGSLDVNTVAIVPKPSKSGFRSNETNLPPFMPTSSTIYQISPIQRSATLSTPSAKSSENSNHLPHHQGLSFISNVPFKPTFRLQVNLPRNQLMVLRVSPESSIGQIKAKICEEKELDLEKYQLTAKDKEMLLLDPMKCLADYGIHEVSLISNNHLSKVRMEQSTSNINGGLKESSYQDQMSGNEYQTSACQTAGKSNKAVKKRPAPLPPSKSRINDESIGVEKADKILFKQSTGTHRDESYKSKANEKVVSSSSHLRQDSGSDSSGYHESLASSESPRNLTESINQQEANLNIQNKLNDKEISKKVIVKKRQAPLPPNWKNNSVNGVGVNGGGSNCSTSSSSKSEIGESIDCLSDVSVPLSSSSSGSSRRSDYRIVNGRNSSLRSSLHGDDSSFTLVGESDDMDDIGTLKGSNSAPIPSPDSGTCSHVPLDEEKGSDGMASASGSAIMGDSAISDTIIEEADIELEERGGKDDLYKDELNESEIMIRSTTPLPLTDESSNDDVAKKNFTNLKTEKVTSNIDTSMDIKSHQTVDDCDEDTIDSSESFSVIRSDGSVYSVNEISTSTLSSNVTSFDESENHASVKPSFHCDMRSDEIRRDLSAPKPDEEPHVGTVASLNNEIEESSVDNIKKIKETNKLTETLPSPFMSLISSSSPSFTTKTTTTTTSSLSMTSDPLKDKFLNSITINEPTHNQNSKTVIQKEDLSIECMKTPTNINVKKPVVKQEDKEVEKSLNNERVINRNDCLLGHDRSKVKVFNEMTTSEPDNINIESKKDLSIEEVQENQNIGQNQGDKSVSSQFVRDLCRPRVRLTNFKIGSYNQINNLDIYQNSNQSKTTNGNSDVTSNDVESNFGNERPKSLVIDTVKPVIVTASLKNGNASACYEFGHNNNNNNSKSINTNNKISMIAPQPFKLNRLASWSGADTKSFRQAYANVTNTIEDRETIAEKAEKIEKVLRIERPVDRVSGLVNSSGSSNGHRCVSQIEINGDSAKVCIRNTVSTIENDESPIQVTTFVKSDHTPVLNYKQMMKETDLQTVRVKQHKQQSSNLPDTKTKLEIIKTVKSKMEPMSSRFAIPSFNSAESKSSIIPKMPVPILPSSIPPPPPPPPPMPNTKNGCKQIVKSVPKYKKTNSSTSKTDFHDALLNEIRACGGRGALRKVNIHR